MPLAGGRFRLRILVQFEGRERKLDLFIILVENFDAQDCRAVRGHFRPPLVNHQMSLEPGPLDIFAGREKVFCVPSFEDDLCLALIEPSLIRRLSVNIRLPSVSATDVGPDGCMRTLRGELAAAHSQALIGNQIHDRVTHKSP
jgi:hypothetical protein